MHLTKSFKERLMNLMQPHQFKFSKSQQMLIKFKVVVIMLPSL